MKVKRDNLMLIAGIVWMIAGVNILVIGLLAYGSSFDLAWWALVLMLLGTVCTVTLFHVMFGKMVKKHVARIRSYEDKPHNPLLFFDLKGYVIMAFMITLGVFLRTSGFVPLWLIASFYTGLGSSLLLAGIGFLLHRFHEPNWSFHQSKLS